MQVVDFDGQSLRRTLPRIVGAIQGALAGGGRVYVHCTAGLGRAPAACIAWAYWFGGAQLDEARCPPVPGVLNFLRVLSGFGGPVGGLGVVMVLQRVLPGCTNSAASLGSSGMLVDAQNPISYFLSQALFQTWQGFVFVMHVTSDLPVKGEYQSVYLCPSGTRPRCC